MSDGRVMTQALQVSHPTSRMRAVAVLGAALLLLALAAPASARPTRECGNDEFDLMDMEAFRDLSIEVGVPADILFTPEWEAGWASYDKNGDGNLCVKDKPDTPGHLGSWVWNVVDNTSNH